MSVEMKVVDGVRVRPEDVERYEARAKAQAAAEKERKARATARKKAAKPANKQVTPDADKATGKTDTK